MGPRLLSEGTSGERLVALVKNAAPQRLGRCLAGYAAAPICLLLPGVAVTEGRFALRPPHQTKCPATTTSASPSHRSNCAGRVR